MAEQRDPHPADSPYLASRTDGLPQSIFVADDAPVHVMPTSVISRPLQSSLDEAKVEDFMRRIQAGEELHPIEVAWVDDGPGRQFYFSFGGCHRWAAHQRLGVPNIDARIVKVSADTISTYLGASSPFRRKEQQQATQ